MNDHSRRGFISTVSRALGSGWAAAQWPLLLTAATTACERRESGAGYIHLSTDLVATLGAVAEQILPADETPGAREIGVTWFIDALFEGPWGAMQSMVEGGARALDEQAGSAGFAGLPFEQQTAMLQRIEGESFFQVMRLLTLAGVFAMPARGGNRDKSGWSLIGFEDRHAWQPPFGHYDMQASAKSSGRQQNT